MTRPEVFQLIDTERKYQSKWGDEFDSKNTINDWTTYIVKYLGKAVAMSGTTAPGDIAAFREQIVKVAALAVAVLEREEYAPRHYDSN